MRRRTKLLAIVAMSLLACDMQPNPQRQAAVVVYATYADEAYWSGFFSGFTEETGIPVSIRHGDATALVDDVIANRGSPPADVLLTASVADIWRAADKGALRPIQSPRLASLSKSLQDEDGLWAAVNYRLTVIVAASQTGNPRPADYPDLASPRFRGHVCLLSSRLSISRSLLAMLIAELGAKPAELIVRGWVQNLALPPFATQQKLMAAIRSGKCPYGILSESILDSDVHTIVPEPAYFDIEGTGIARHARYPESAQRLVDWMLARKSTSTDTGVIGRNIGLAGWHDEDAQLLAERAGYE